ncbi:hypothetical protein [Alkalicoccus daliensis]|uniref:Uncharacterized protein n=1 Tax=Alkalicoccus daliensis TaxID=745820 RepID=A0A1H0IG84_9BACI|nr:hypothetical protein [Alkalicoccus daliensis]SDO30051.1 hypothetical protein SAMN04488053_110119 [Alkalicoccus daliensis]
MARTKLSELSYGEFQQLLVKSVMDQMDNTVEQSPLVYFPVVHDRVESFLFIHWKEVFENCSDLTVDEWFSSSCYDKFYNDVLVDFKSKNFETDTMHHGSQKEQNTMEPLT